MTVPKPGGQFKAVVTAARTESWAIVQDEIETWVKTSTEARRFYSNGVLHNSLSSKLLAIVVLESRVDVTNKINGLVMKYNADVEASADGEIDMDRKGLLSLAITTRNSVAAIALLEMGADPNKMYSMWGTNSFVFAAANNLLDVVKTMHRCGAVMWQMNAMGDTGIVGAVKEGYIDMVKFFLDKGADSNWFCSEDHMYLLHYAVESRDPSSIAMMKLLLDSGADPNLRSFRPGLFGFGMPGSGYTPLQYLQCTTKGVTRYREFKDEDLPTVNEKVSLLEDNMVKRVTDLQLAVCMGTHERLSSNTSCLLNCLAGEPGLLKMILDNVGNEFDVNYPSVPMRPSSYTGVVE
jgi:ankyrin repeat protein